MASRLTLAWLLAVASACARTRPPLGEANEIRLDAVVELTAARARSAICLSVDSRSGSSRDMAGFKTFARAQDPEGELFQAVSRMGPVYPASRCQDGNLSEDGAVRHPGGGERPGVFVTLGAVNVSADGQHAHLLAAVSAGALLGEVRRLHYRRQDATWQLHSDMLLLQE